MELVPLDKDEEYEDMDDDMDDGDGEDNLELSETSGDVTESRLARLRKKSPFKILSSISLFTFEDCELMVTDAMGLGDDAWLNDNVVNFWIRYFEKKILSPEEQARSYFFSTLFYDKLTKDKNPQTTATGTATKQPTATKKLTTATNKQAIAVAGHSRDDVNRWTKNVDIFSKDFVFVPICQNRHWFLAVICFPGLLGLHDLETGEPIADCVPHPQREGPAAAAGSRAREAAGAKKTKIKQPCILIFDSSKSQRDQVCSSLREYLAKEFKARKGSDREFLEVTMPAGMMNVPQQENGNDCGAYALHFLEKFFRSPIPSFELPIDSNNQIWPESKAQFGGIRQEIYDAIVEVAKEMNPVFLRYLPRLSPTAQENPKNI